MSKLISSVKQLAVWVEDDEVVIDQDDFDRDGDLICNKISVTVHQIPQLVEWLLKAADELNAREKAERGKHANA
jgi:hypothetical protein